LCVISFFVIVLYWRFIYYLTKLNQKSCRMTLTVTKMDRTDAHTIMEYININVVCIVDCYTRPKLTTHKHIWI
jgi:hypothetical protein